jgi:hypothetical protein
MLLLEFARRQPQWLRVVLAAVLFGFAMGSIAHIAHQPDPVATSAARSVQCGRSPQEEAACRLLRTTDNARRVRAGAG